MSERKRLDCYFWGQSKKGEALLFFKKGKVRESTERQNAKGGCFLFRSGIGRKGGTAIGWNVGGETAMWGDRGFLPGGPTAGRKTKERWHGVSVWDDGKRLQLNYLGKKRTYWDHEGREKGGDQSNQGEWVLKEGSG